MFPSTSRFDSRRSSFGARALRTLIVLLVVAVLAVGIAWYVAGKAEGPVIRVSSPARAIGQTGELDMLLETPGTELERLDVVFEQGGTPVDLFKLEGEKRAALTPAGEGRYRLVLPLGKRELPQLEEGKAKVVITAARPTLFGYRSVESTATHEFDVQLTPPSVAALSTFHYINVGGSEAVVYRVSPTATVSGVRVGETEYPGYPATGAGISNADSALRVAFFALGWNQDPGTPIRLFARDDVGNEGRADFDFRVFPKSFRASRIELDDRFLAKVVPAILENTPDLKVENPSDLLGSFLRINRDLRAQNGDTISALARETSHEILWKGPFKQLVNSAVEGGFADQRTYFYKKNEVDRQVHLGYDLASTAMAPVVAANSGKVVHAGYLGIYGNCVIVDHGMGLQSLYAHLSHMDVKPGAMVNQGDALGRTGATGLAGGDHLHFTMLLGGTAVTPIEWWSPQWVRDRITRKITEAQGLSPKESATAQTTAP